MSPCLRDREHLSPQNMKQVVRLCELINQGESRLLREQEDPVFLSRLSLLSPGAQVSPTLPLGT